MDLLDLELDLRVESSSTPALTTRRSSRGAPPFTPTSTAKKSTPKTPKTPKTISKSQASVPVTPVTSKPTTANKTAIRKAEEPKIKKTPTTESVNSPQTSLAQSTDRDSRSMSLEKRSRNKVKKRFSPSPDIPSSKKRKTMTPRAVAGSTTQPDSATPRSSSVISSRPKKIKLASGVEFAHSLSELNESFQSREPEDFVLPEDLKSLGEPSETVDQIIKIVKDRDAAAAAAAKKAVEKAAKTGKKSKKSASKTEKTEPPKIKIRIKPSPPVITKAKSQPQPQPVCSDSDEGTSNRKSRVRSFSKEFGVSDDNSNDAEPHPLSSPKATTETPTAVRKSSRKSAGTRNDGDPKEVKQEVEENPPISLNRRISKRISGVSQISEPIPEKKSTPKVKKSKETTLPAPPIPENTTQETSKIDDVDPEEATPRAVNPNSALAIRQRLMGTSSLEKSKAKGGRPPRKSNVLETPVLIVEPKVEKIKKEDSPEPPPPTPSAPVPSTSAPPKSPKSSSKPVSTPTSVPAKAVSSTRTSGRVSKPNRLYADQSFNTEILGRKTITEQNSVLEAIARESTPVVSDTNQPSTSSSSSSPPKPQAPKKQREYVPKPIPIINGVFRGYVPSVKLPLEDVEIDGVVENLNDTVNSVMDAILLEVCSDGVRQHENIDPKVVKSKKQAKIDLTKRLKKEARKLDIAMRDTAPEDVTGKRKRHAPKTDDMYWTPSSKLKIAPIREEKEASTPKEDTVVIADEKKQQAARISISHLIDAEIDESIKEAKKFSLSFDKYIQPKISAAKKRSSIKLMSRKRNTASADDFYYHEMLTEQCSPTNSNVENVEADVDVDGEIDAPVPQDVAIGIRTDALDMAEQIAVLLPRPTRQDGSPVPMDELQIKALEQTENRKASLQTTMNIVMEQLSHESAPAVRDVEEVGCMWHTVTSKNAQMLMDAFTISSADREDAVTWTHQFLVENLPIHVLASYLSVLRYARRIFNLQNPSRFGYVVNSTDGIDEEWSQATILLKSFVYKRSADPGTEKLNNTVPYRRMTDTVFLLVSPTMAFGAHSAAPTNIGSSSSSHNMINQTAMRQRQHGQLLHWLQLIGHPDSEMIGFNEEQNSSCSVAEYLSDVLVETICDKVRRMSKEKPNIKIVLVGFGSTTYLVHRAANLVGGIWAVISIAFPVMTKFGRRGTADDEILLTYCPTLFIVGSEGQRFNNEAMAELRSSMITPSGLVVVGHANDHLLVPSSILLGLGISQKIVYRMVLEKILDFLSLEKIREQSSANLKPIELNNVYDLDSSLLKSEKALSGLAFANTPLPGQGASPVGSSSGRRATVSGGGEESALPKRKKQDPPPTIPISQVSPALFPSRVPMPPPSASVQGHFESFQTLMAASVATADDMPRRASMGSSPRVVERGDLRDRASTLSVFRPLPSTPPPPPPAPKGPIDPASISLN